MANTKPVFSAGRTGEKSPASDRGWFNDLVQLPSGKYLLGVIWDVGLLNADGSVDTSFGNEGFVKADLAGPKAFNNSYDLQELLPLENGQVLVAGGASTSDTVRNQNAGLALIRLNADGSKDMSFGSGGVTHHLVSTISESSLVDIAVLPDGRIVGLGRSANIFDPITGAYKGGGAEHMVLARYLSDGKLDTSFGNGGIKVDLGTTDLRAASMALQADGKMVVVAEQIGANYQGKFNVFRFNQDGSRDAGFGNGGHLVVEATRHNHGNAVDVKIQPDGKIVIAGYAYMDGPFTRGFAVVRLNADGTLDRSFGDNGRTVVHIEPQNGQWKPQGKQDSYAQCEELCIAEDGAITLVGYVYRGEAFVAYTPELAVVRLDRNGRPDTAFGGDGQQTYANGLSSVDSAMVNGAGNIMVTGKVTGGTSWTPVVFEIRPDGSLSTSFGEKSDAVSNGISYAASGQAQVLNEHISVHDADLSASRTNYGGASLTLMRKGAANAGDLFSAKGELSFRDGQAFVGAVDIGAVTIGDGSLRIDFNVRATEALVSKALAAIAYEHRSPFGSATKVQIDWTFSDGNAGLQGTGGALQAQFSTTVALVTPELPYWLEGAVGRAFPGQTAANFRAEQHMLLGQNLEVRAAFGSAGGAVFAGFEQTQVEDQLKALAAVSGLRIDTDGAALTFHPRLDTGPYQGANLLGVDGAAIYFDFVSNTGSNAASILQVLGRTLGVATQGGSALHDLDIAALQYLYGPDAGARSGNDVYMLDELPSNFIWDGAGNDTISAAGIKQDVTFSLTPGEWGHIGGRADAITAAGQVTVNYGSMIENATGGEGNDSISGNGGANALSGGAGKDRLEGRGGGDRLDGGSGIDFALYAGARSGYHVGRDGKGGFAVKELASGSVDTLQGIERIAFGDMHIAIDIDGNAGQAYRLYQACFGRQADLAGLGYWIDAMDEGMSVLGMASLFSSTPEFAKLYGASPGAAAFVTRLYDNVLHRAPDSAGLAWWSGVLESKAISFADALVQFSDSAENHAQLIGQMDGGVAFLPSLG